MPPPLPPGHGSHPPSCSRLCVGRSNNGKTAEGGGIPGDGAEAGDRAQAHLPLRPRREPRAGVRGEVRGPGSCPFPWGQHDHTELGTKGPSSRQRPGLCGGGSVPHAEGAGRGLQSEPVSRNPLHLLWTDGRRPLQEVMRAPPGSPLGQGHGPRATGEGAGGQACCVLAPLSSSGPPTPSKSSFPDHYVCASSGVCLSSALALTMALLADPDLPRDSPSAPVSLGRVGGPGTQKGGQGAGAMTRQKASPGGRAGAQPWERLQCSECRRAGREFPARAGGRAQGGLGSCPG